MAKIFISHSSIDKSEIAIPLFNHLKKDHTVWYDSDQIRISDNIPTKIAEGLDNSDYFVLLISEDYNRSGYCRMEQNAIFHQYAGNTEKRPLIIRINNANIDIMLESFRRIDYYSGRTNMQEIYDTLDNALKTPIAHVNQADSDMDNLIEDILKFNQGLIRLKPSLSSSDTIRDKESILNEGVILIKPGGTFYKPCLKEIFKRITTMCIINTIIVFDGKTIEHLDLFDKQYNTPVRIAKGEIALSEQDYNEIDKIYNTVEFEQEYGVAYNHSLVFPALKLCKEEDIAFDELTRLWDEGREPSKFWNGKYNGLNKIGYQKSVYPIKRIYKKQPCVRIVVNGYVPGLKKLFTDDRSRVIALHISSNEQWNDLKLNLIGHNSDPNSCKDGTIRKDAIEKKIDLDPTDHIVNGQRNICHLGGCVFDGMRELNVWFNIAPADTILGKMLEGEGISTESIKIAMDNSLPNISWLSTKNGKIDDVLFHVIDEADALNNFIFEEKIKPILRDKGDALIKNYCDEAGLNRDMIRKPDLINMYNSIEKRIKSFITEGLYYKTLENERYFARRVAKVFDNEENLICLFYEVVMEIEKLIHRDDNINVSSEIVAEAYKIAANDIKFISNDIYKNNFYSPILFYSKIVTELPEQAINCAKRIKYNFVKKLSSISTDVGSDNPTCLRDRVEWKDFLKDDLQNLLKRHKNTGYSSPITTLILCGGRSTRMNSTIPKHILPLREKFLFDWVSDMISEATDKSSTIYAATGFRFELSDMVYGNRIRNIENKVSIGPAFRVATCLETLKDNEGLFIVVYTDMPYISQIAVRKLIEIVKNKNDDSNKTFGMLTSDANLSGYVVRDAQNKIERVIQGSIAPMNINDEMRRDVGLYVFYNTQEFRDALLDVSNSNVRGEYYFADVVHELYKKGWNIIDVEETKANSRCVNTSSDLLLLASDIDVSFNFDVIRDNFKRNYKMSIPEHNRDRNTLRDAIMQYNGPFYFIKFPE
ncbi:Toll-Interleukin receptor domain protein [Candidatus Magnetobacterium bavaricum]|uniref:Toll-Interleukin receptor domain protein n=1 Tax=Candidatus Magnetobacterium bavaricum TaxID=29290 RepID=A0A0F3GVV4_9BACT|nr:Toll-Interleukin receptor domain protein [Candidatus Magnetobacterium bavaricum]